MDLGLLQQDAARLVGCSKAAFLMWEKGRSSPEIRFWPAIVEFLGYDPSPEPRSTAERLKAARRAAGWSQKRLALVLGVDPSAVQDWEAGKEPHLLRCRRAVEKLLGDLGVGSWR